MKNQVSLAISIVLSCLLLSCERTQEGTLDPPLGKSPFMESASLVLSTIDLDTSASPLLHRNDDGTYTLSDTISAALISYETSVRVDWSVLSEDGSEELGTGRATISIPTERLGASYLRSIPMEATLSRANVGRVIVQVTATDAANRQSNTLFLPLLVARRNSLPAITYITLPDTIFRPSSGFTLLLFTAAVQDSDGYADIAEVSFRRTLPVPTASIQLYDDGGAASGDPFAGDAWFSRVVRIDSSARLGEQVFEFMAKDKSGTWGLPVLDTIVIESR